MAYVMRCDACGLEEEFNAQNGDLPPTMLSCEECGTDGCDQCMPGGVCDDCQMTRDAEDEETD